jgi:hypothetical protein
MKPPRLFRRKLPALILGRRVEEGVSGLTLWLDLQYSQEGQTKYTTVCRGDYADRNEAQREIARWPVGSTYQY